MHFKIDGLMQERRNSIANALELCLSYTNPLKYSLQMLTILKHQLCLWIPFLSMMCICESEFALGCDVIYTAMKMENMNNEKRPLFT